jgi:hypothetical protein
MAGHVTFIHGIGNQPEPDRMLRNWKRALADGGDGVDLGASGVTSSMVYWADVMYRETSDAASDHEAMSFEGVSTSEVPSIDESYFESADAEERAFIAAMVDKFHLDASEEIPVPELEDVDESRAHELEAVPLPWFIKRPLMRILLRDVHHYLFNSSHTPRPGETYRVRDEIRARFLASLGDVDRHPHVVIAHSMGTVITYDVLKRVADSPDVDAVITLGSPLGLSEIQDQMAPEYSARDGFPAKTATWSNFADGLDPVCAADPKMANDYRQDDQKVVDDVMVKNDGLFRHPVSKYLRQPSLQATVRTLLGL